MPARTAQKTVLITGCTPGGIGHALAKEFHAKGLHVIATARNPSLLKDLVDLGMSAMALEVQSPESIRACHEEVAEICGGKLDILVNNAGCTHISPATDVDLADARAVFETNVFGVMAMCQAFAGLLITARGLVINMSSLAATTPYVFGSVYCASKGALVSYSRTLRAELRPFGVRVTIVVAGQVQSRLSVGRTFPDLPPDSFYLAARDVYEARLAFSQTRRKMPPEVFSRRLVARVLKPEAPSFLRACGFGRPDWFWEGRNTGLVWWGLVLGEWVVDAVMYRMFGMPKIEQLLRQQEHELRKMK